MAQPILTFYKDRDNSILLKLYQNSIELNYTTLTKVTIDWRSGLVDSVANPTLFTINSSGIRLRLGSLSLTPTVNLSALLIIHTAGWPNGIIWGERLTIKLLPGT